MENFTIDDMRKAFLAGRDSKEPILKCEPFGDMEEYASYRITQSFKEFMHE